MKVCSLQSSTSIKLNVNKQRSAILLFVLFTLIQIIPLVSSLGTGATSSTAAEAAAAAVVVCSTPTGPGPFSVASRTALSNDFLGEFGTVLTTRVHTMDVANYTNGTSSTRTFTQVTTILAETYGELLYGTWETDMASGEIQRTRWESAGYVRGIGSEVNIKASMVYMPYCLWNASSNITSSGGTTMVWGGENGFAMSFPEYDWQLVRSENMGDDWTQTYSGEFFRNETTSIFEVSPGPTSDPVRPICWDGVTMRVNPRSGFTLLIGGKQGHTLTGGILVCSDVWRIGFNGSMMPRETVYGTTDAPQPRLNITLLSHSPAFGSLYDYGLVWLTGDTVNSSSQNSSIDTSAFPLGVYVLIGGIPWDGAGQTKKVYWSVDDGHNWIFVADLPFWPTWPRTFAFLDVIYLLPFDDDNMYASRDGGVNWNLIDSAISRYRSLTRTDYPPSVFFIPLLTPRSFRADRSMSAQDSEPSVSRGSLIVRGGMDQALHNGYTASVREETRFDLCVNATGPESEPWRPLPLNRTLIPLSNWPTAQQIAQARQNLGTCIKMNGDGGPFDNSANFPIGTVSSSTAASAAAGPCNSPNDCAGTGSAQSTSGMNGYANDSAAANSASNKPYKAVAIAITLIFLFIVLVVVCLYKKWPLKIRDYICLRRRYGVLEPGQLSNQPMPAVVVSGDNGAIAMTSLVPAENASASDKFVRNGFSELNSETAGAEDVP